MNGMSSPSGKKNIWEATASNEAWRASSSPSSSATKAPVTAASLPPPTTMTASARKQTKDNEPWDDWETAADKEMAREEAKAQEETRTDGQETPGAKPGPTVAKATLSIDDLPQINAEAAFVPPTIVADAPKKMKILRRPGSGGDGAGASDGGRQGSGQNADGRRISSSGSGGRGSGGHGANGGGGVADNRFKTTAEREAEYAAARLRIFGGGGSSSSAGAGSASGGSGDASGDANGNDEQARQTGVTPPLVVKAELLDTAPAHRVPASRQQQYYAQQQQQQPYYNGNGRNSNGGGGETEMLAYGFTNAGTTYYPPHGSARTAPQPVVYDAYGQPMVYSAQVPYDYAAMVNPFPLVGQQQQQQQGLHAGGIGSAGMGDGKTENGRDMHPQRNHRPFQGKKNKGKKISLTSPAPHRYNASPAHARPFP